MRWRRLLDALLSSYFAAVLVPALVLGGALGPPRTAGGPAVLVGGGLVVLTMLAVRPLDDLTAALTWPPVAALTVGAPLAYLLYVLLAAEPRTVRALYGAVGVLAIVPGILVPVGAALLRSHRLRTAATEHVVVTVGDESEGRGSQAAVGAAVLGGVGSIVAGALVLFGTTGSGDGTGAAAGVLTGVCGTTTAVLQFAAADRTEVAVTDEGLRVDRAMIPWDHCEGYRVTESDIELVRSAWYRPNRRFDRGGVTDEAALRTALRTYVPRIDGRGRVEAPAAR